MDPPHLKLIMVKGPREGETLEFPIGSTIRIGRILRGNNLPIKDPGISTKHLTINFDFVSSKWTVTDLDSSNGTTVNATMISAHFPQDLVDGDIIKLGDCTTILVKISGGEESAVRRNPRRLVKMKDVKVELVENSPEIKEGRGRGRGRSQKDDEEKGENVRVTRGRKNVVVPENVEVSVVPEKTEVEKKTRGGGGGGRKRKNLTGEGKEELNLRRLEGVHVEKVEVLREDGGGVRVGSRGEVEGVRVTRGRKNGVSEKEVECSVRENNEGRKTRGVGARKGKNLTGEDKELNLRGREGGDVEKVEVLIEERGEGVGSRGEVENARVTRGRKNRVLEIAEVECGARENSEGKQTHGGRGGGRRKRKNLKEEDKENLEDKNTENLNPWGRVGGEEVNVENLNLCGREGREDENAENLDSRGREGHEEENVEVFREEGGEEDAVSRGKVENGDNCEGEVRDGKAVEGFDLEKMTLGQFFDYMEVNLRKQIIQETEELIEGMRRKAEGVKEYIAEMKENGKVPVS